MVESEKGGLRECEEEGSVENDDSRGEQASLLFCGQIVTAA